MLTQLDLLLVHQVGNQSIKQFGVFLPLDLLVFEDLAAADHAQPALFISRHVDADERFVGGEGDGPGVHDDEGGLDGGERDALRLDDVADLLLHVLVVVAEVGRVLGQAADDAVEVVVHDAVLDQGFLRVVLFFEVDSAQYVRGVDCDAEVFQEEVQVFGKGFRDRIVYHDQDTPSFLQLGFHCVEFGLCK